jgi:hypothetical protein
LNATKWRRFSSIGARSVKIMPKCGVCGWSFSARTLVKHAETPCGEEDSKAEARPYSPEVDDLIKIMEEERGY